MNNTEKRGTIIISLFLLLLPGIMAVGITQFPSSVNPGFTFSVTLSGNTGNIVGCGRTAWSWHPLTGVSTISCDITAPSSGNTFLIYAAEDNNQDSSPDAGTIVQQSITLNAQDFNSYITITVPSSVAASQPFDITVKVSDNNGIDHFDLRKNGQSLGQKDCLGVTLDCSKTYTTSVTSSTTFQVEVLDSAGYSATQSKTIDVTTQNNPPSFTTASLPAATVGVLYNQQITATDIDGDSLTFTLQSGAGSLGTATCTGTIPKTCSVPFSWTPSTTVTNPISIRTTDTQNHNAFANYDILVNP